MTAPRPWWHYVGFALIGVVVLFGLAVLAFIVLIFVVMGQSGSNK